MKVLITGFGSFGSVTSNPSELLVQELQKINFSAFKLYSEVLPVDYQFCRSWISSQKENYDLVIHLGISPKATLTQLESIAKNTCSNVPDITGFVHESKIDVLGPNEIQTSLDLMLAVDNACFSCELSEDAGSYLCNFIFYLSLQKSQNKKVFFYHMPPKDKISVKQQVKNLQELIQSLLSCY